MNHYFKQLPEASQKTQELLKSDHNYKQHKTVLERAQIPIALGMQ